MGKKRKEEKEREEWERKRGVENGSDLNVSLTFAPKSPGIPRKAERLRCRKRSLVILKNRGRVRSGKVGRAMTEGGTGAGSAIGREEFGARASPHRPGGDIARVLRLSEL